MNTWRNDDKTSCAILSEKILIRWKDYYVRYFAHELTIPFLFEDKKGYDSCYLISAVFTFKRAIFGKTSRNIKLLKDYKNVLLLKRITRMSCIVKKLDILELKASCQII